MAPKGPTVVSVFDISDFPMTLPGLPASIASSPATTLAPETPTTRAPLGPLPSAAASPKPMGPPPVQSSSPKPKAPSREQVQVEVDTIMREAEEKRTKRSSNEQQLHDATLSAIFNLRETEVQRQRGTTNPDPDKLPEPLRGPEVFLWEFLEKKKALRASKGKFSSERLSEAFPPLMLHLRSSSIQVSFRGHSSG